jgi:glutamate synthase (NADPH/NADH) small chain
MDEAGIEGVMDAVAYIAALRQAADLAALPVGRRIVVIGGGMTAIDIASQTKRLGAEDVTIVYRRGPEQMGASAYEQELAQTDGVLLRHWLRPKRLLAEGGRLAGVELEYTDGRAFLPADLDGSREVVELASGRIAVDAERRTSLPDVWAGGDCVAAGKDLTVAAVEDGKQAAMAIDRNLRARTAASAA